MVARTGASITVAAAAVTPSAVTAVASSTGSTRRHPAEGPFRIGSALPPNTRATTPTSTTADAAASTPVDGPGRPVATARTAAVALAVPAATASTTATTRVRRDEASDSRPAAASTTADPAVSRSRSASRFQLPRPRRSSVAANDDADQSDQHHGPAHDDQSCRSP
jgi:hypothetical protein